MHIQESHQTQENKEAKCSKMTEDGHKKSGMNGIIDGGSGNVGAAVKQTAPRNDLGASSSSCGRLKFFKDGKFILELVRAREGERVSWFSVPRKTFWPPQVVQASTGSTPPSHRQESSTSLSVSDDNSSVQSSPWQRDHSWKQNSPRCNVSSEMTFFYHRPSRVHVPVARYKRRRPFDSSNLSNTNNNIRTSTTEIRDKCDSSVQSNIVVKNEIEDGIKIEDTVIVKTEDTVKTENDSEKTKKEKVVEKRKKLVDIVKLLWDKKPQVNNYNAFKSVLLSNIRHEQIVSPRKRILRELERVTIDDVSNKRSRAKPAQSITFTSTTTSTTGSSPSRAHNGTADTTSTKNTSSYSITSLLGHRKEDEPSHQTASIPNDYNNHTSTQLSPTVSQRMIASSVSPSPKSVNYSHSPKLIAHDSPNLSPSPEHYRYMSHQNIAHSSPTHALSPPPDVHKLYRVHGSPNHYSPLHGLVMHQKSSPQYYTPTHRSTASPSSPRSPIDERTAREHNRFATDISSEKNETVGHRLLEMEHIIRPPFLSPYMYPPGPSPFLSHPAYYNAGAYRTPYHTPYSDAISHPPSPQPRNYSTHQNWSHVAQTHTLEKDDDIGSDVPLNLSKHAG